jgi:hypothetical protein
MHGGNFILGSMLAALLLGLAYSKYEGTGYRFVLIWVQSVIL